MPRTQCPLRPIQIDYVCDKCGEGNYRPGKINLADGSFPHTCNNCGDARTFIERYPTLRYAVEGGLIDLENYEEKLC